MTLGAKQVPFATALALNNLAKGVKAAEETQVGQTFETPTPFTKNAFRIEVATKSRPVARVAAKDIQASYLEPYVDGGLRALGTKRGMLAPITGNINLNAYGNLPRNKLKQLQGKPGIFIGPIKTKRGFINGVWQRPGPQPRIKGMKRGMATQAKRPLKLLIKFEDTTPVRKRFPFEQRARAHVARHAAAEFTAALQRAMATAR
jgi:hypothetical protein